MQRAKWYGRDAGVAKFLLGGIASGNISLDSRGQLCDWEILNKPAVNFRPPYSFFAIRTKNGDGDVKAKMLESEILPPFESSHGLYSWMLGGMPRFENSRLCGRCSRAVVELTDASMDVDVEVEGFSPFIPLDYKNSSIPAIIMNYSVKNRTSKTIDVSVCASMCNLVGFVENDLFGGSIIEGTPINSLRDSDNINGVFCSSDLASDDLRAGSMAIAALISKNDISVRRSWLNGNWWDGAHDFWDDFVDDGRIEPEGSDIDSNSKLKSSGGKLQIGSVCQNLRLNAGETACFPFVISWYFPNRPSKWNGHIFAPESECNENIAKNYYANYFSNAWEAADYLCGNLEILRKKTLDFENALYSSTLSDAMLEAVTANITVLRSTTCFRFANGTFFGWEGTFNTRGCCEGNCTHVWNYEQTMAFLFPELEQSMRRTEFLIETDEKGSMAFRTSQSMGNKRFELYPPAADGQMGCVVRLYREWKLSGDFSLIRDMWDSVKRSMDYALKYWDTDGDFVFDGMQHNTYDVEFYGVSSLTNGVFFAALLAASIMAEAMGDKKLADYYREGWKKGSALLDKTLFNGSYYVQKLENFDKYKYQYGDGCLSDQLLGQQLAHITGLGYILPEDHVKKAISSVFDNNFRSDLRDHFNVQRAYAVSDEGGLLMCSWPNGNRPRFPFPYSDEIWTGVEYQVATELIYDGFYDKAEQIVKTLRERYDGVKRNPWNEVECGNHYARSMASWGLLLAVSGCEVDLTKNEISFNPAVSGDFKCFFSTAKSWGVYRRELIGGETKESIDILYGDKSLKLAKRL